MGSDFEVVALEPSSTVQVAGVTGSINSPADGGAQGAPATSSGGLNAAAIFGVLFGIICFFGAAWTIGYLLQKNKAMPLTNVHTGPTTGATISVPGKMERPTTELVTKGKIDNFAQI